MKYGSIHNHTESKPNTEEDFGTCTKGDQKKKKH